jgi:hypothetical protein
MPKNQTLLAFTPLHFFVFIALLGCSTNRKVQDENSLLEAVVVEKIGQPYSVAYNVSKNHGLFEEKRVGDHVGRTIKYIVMRLEDRLVVHEGNYRLGVVKWKDDSSIEVTTFSSIRDEVGTKKIVNITNLE